MNEQTKTSSPVWFWVVALLWNMIGGMIFLTEVFAQESMMESMTEPQKEWAQSTPMWIYVVFAIAVVTGLAGSVCLLMRNRLAVPLFIVGFVAVVIQMVYTMVIAGGLQVMGPSGAVMPTMVVTLALVWLLFSRHFKSKSWIR
jgi:hypothetical protein